MKTWAMALPPMGKNWAKQQDDAGMPGTQDADRLDGLHARQEAAHPARLGQQ